MMNFLGSITGALLRFVYTIVAGAFGSEPKTISFFAISIIFTTIIFKLALLPLSVAQTKGQLKIAELQPELQKLQKKYKNDPQTLATKQQQLYKEANYNPFSGCLPLLIQFPIIIAFYGMFRDPSKFAFTEAGQYANMAKHFFYLTDLSKIDTSMILPILAGLTTFLLSYITSKNRVTQDAQSGEQAESMMKTMNIMMPIFLFWISRSLAAGLVLYWVVSNLFSVVQQLISNSLVAKKEEASLE